MAHMKECQMSKFKRMIQAPMGHPPRMEMRSFTSVRVDPDLPLSPKIFRLCRDRAKRQKF